MSRFQHFVDSASNYNPYVYWNKLLKVHICVYSMFFLSLLFRT